MSKRFACVIILTAWALGFVPAQETAVHLNDYYRFPASLSFAYQPLAAMGGGPVSDFVITEFAGELRTTLPSSPTVQPLVRAGLLTYSFTADVETVRQDWTHRHVYAAAGMGYATRISREFEVGADGFAGVSQSYFPELTLDGEKTTMGQLNAVGGAAARLALNPSYNVSIAVTPSLRYVHGLGPLDDYNGFTFGIGVGVSYRFGEDPDAAAAQIRAVRFSRAELPDAFAAMQSVYSSRPLGSVTIENTENYEITAVEVSFMQAGFMDSPTPSVRIDAIAPGEMREVPILASFNDQVFTTQGITPLTGEIIVQYVARNRPVEQRHSVVYDLHDRNALRWDDDRKAAAFVTQQDSAIRNYASFVRRAHREITNPFVSEHLQFAMQVYHALSEIGILYQADPTSPFTAAQSDTLVVDSVNLPRETLSRLTGDCDDLTVLYNAILQSAGVETALVTTPGHIYSAINTGVSSREFGTLHPDRAMTIELDGELWVPVEITLIGSAPFLEAWGAGVAEYHRYDDDARHRGFYRTSEAQTLFRPVALRESDLGLQYGSESSITASFTSDRDRWANIVLAAYRQEAQSSNEARDWNAYGIAAAKLEQTTAARTAFTRALQVEPDSLHASLNLGLLAYMEGDYIEARSVLENAEAIISEGRRFRDSHRTTLFINLSKTNYELGDYERAREYYLAAERIDDAAVAAYRYLSGGGTQETDPATGQSSDVRIASGESRMSEPVTTGPHGRAASAGGVEPVLFFSE